MLNTFRTKIKFWSNIALWPVIIAFIAFYGWSFSGQEKQDTVPAVTIYESEIGQEHVMRNRQDLIRYYRNIYQDNFERMANNLDFDQMAIDRIVNTQILMNTAEELGIKVSADEIQQTILSYPYFQKDGRFSPSQYEGMLQRMGMTPAQYESSIAQDIKMEKVRTLLGAAAPVTEEEVRERYEQNNVKINTSYLMFKSSDFKDQVSLTDDEYKNYYEKNSEEFRVEDQIQVKYILFDPKNYENQIDPSEDEIDDYYLENADKYLQPEQAKASHILIKVNADAPEESWTQAKDKLLNLKEKIESGEATFEEMAREHSEDTTAESGGDLGFFQKGRMVKPFEEAVWDAEIDQIVGPVRTQFGYHLIKKTDFQKQTIKPIDEIEKSIRQTLITEKSKELAMEKAREAFDLTNENTTLEDLNEEVNAQIKTTDFFVPKNPPRDLGRSRELLDVLTALEPGVISIPVETFKGVYLFYLNDTKESYIPAYEEVAEQVKMKAETARAGELAKEKAEEVHSDLMNDVPWDDAVGKFELESLTTGEFGKGSYIPKVGSDEDLVDKLFALNTGDISGVHEIRNSYFIFKIDDYRDFDSNDFQEQIPEIRRQLLATRRQQTVNSWLENKKQQMKENGQLIIHQPAGELTEF